MKLSDKVDELFDAVRNRRLSDGPLENKDVDRVRKESDYAVACIDKALSNTYGLSFLLCLFFGSMGGLWIAPRVHEDYMLALVFMLLCIVVIYFPIYMLVVRSHRESRKKLNVLTGYWLQEPASYDLGSKESVDRLLDCCLRMPEIEEFRQKALSMRKLLRADVGVMQNYAKGSEADTRSGTPLGRLNTPELLVAR